MSASSIIADMLAEQESPGGAISHFLKIPAIRIEFIDIAARVCDQLSGREVDIEEQDLVGFVIKSPKFCAKRQWKLADIAPMVPSIADAISVWPPRLADPAVTLQKMLDLHIAHCMQARADLRRQWLLSDSPEAAPATVAHSPDGRYVLVECLTLRHLDEETAAFGHCVRGGQRDYYCDKLARGAARIFSLRTVQGEPVATVEYDTRARSIIQIEKQRDENEGLLTGTEPFFLPMPHSPGLRWLSTDRQYNRTPGAVRRL
jgi:PcfJ-like protein